MSDILHSIDDVIKAMECCSNYELRCSECPYLNDHFLGRDCVGVMNLDVMHYLKELQYYWKHGHMRPEPVLFRSHTVYLSNIFGESGDENN